MAGRAEGIRSTILVDGSVKLESARGSALLTTLAPGVLLYTCRGVLGEAFHPPMVEPAQREVRQTGALVMFVDGWDLRSVDTKYREAWTEWFKQHRQHFRMRLLVRSKLMDMAASLANLFTGISVIKTYSNVAAWEAACTVDHKGFRRSVQVSV